MSILAEKTGLTKDLEQVYSLLDVHFSLDTLSPVTLNDIQKTVIANNDNSYTIRYAIPKYEDDYLLSAEIKKDENGNFSLENIDCNTSDHVDGIERLRIEGEDGIKEVKENAYTGPYNINNLILSEVDKIGSRGFDTRVESLSVLYSERKPEYGFNSIGNPHKISIFAPTIQSGIDFIDIVSKDTKAFPSDANLSINFQKAKMENYRITFEDHETIENIR